MALPPPSWRAFLFTTENVILTDEVFLTLNADASVVLRDQVESELFVIRSNPAANKIGMRPARRPIGGRNSFSKEGRICFGFSSGSVMNFCKRVHTALLSLLIRMSWPPFVNARSKINSLRAELPFSSSLSHRCAFLDTRTPMSFSATDGPYQSRSEQRA